MFTVSSRLGGHMYQGKNRTALASQRQLADAMVVLMHRMPYTEISVAELCREASVSRQTFYSLFQNKANVIRYLLRESCDPYVPEREPDVSHLRQMCRYYALYITGHREIMSLLVDNGMTAMISDMLLRAFQKDGLFGHDLLEEQRKYHALFLAGGLTRLAKTFIKENTEAKDIEEIVYLLMYGNSKAFDQ